MNPMGKMLIFMGIILVLVGIGFLLAPRVPWLGRLPGDINIRRSNFSFHFPIVTSIILSIVLTIILNFFMRNR